MISKLRRFLASFLVVLMAVPMPSQAAMLGTDAADAGASRNRVNQMLERTDVQERLSELGVSPDAVKERVAALTDDEVASLAERIDSLPAGGNSVIGALVFVFIVLLITDILGLTKIFPFTRPLR